MIGTTRQLRVFAYRQPADLRKGFDGLYGLVSIGMQLDALSGDLYVFINKTRKRAKVLYWDGTGLCVLAKRLEQGRFTAPWRQAGDGPLQLSMSELGLLLEGSDLQGRIPLSPPVFLLKKRLHT